MNELGLEASAVLSWFTHDTEQPFIVIRVSPNHASTWAEILGRAVRRCYVADEVVEANARRLAMPEAAIVATRLPDPGSTMAGDFGEILTYLYQAAREHPTAVIGPKKWRLKEDRTKPAKLSDVVQFVLPTWPAPSPRDAVLCAETKTKSTAGQSHPIAEAIADSAKDRTSRLGRTLLWLRERATTEELGAVRLEHLDRFLNASEHPAAEKRFRAVAVVCSSLLPRELADAPTDAPNCSVVVIAVPDLKNTYTSVFRAALGTPSCTAPSVVDETGDRR